MKTKTTRVAMSVSAMLAVLAALILVITRATPRDTAVRFAGDYTACVYTALGAFTIAASLILFKGEESHSAIAMVCLYVCTMVTVERIWELCFAVNTHFFDPGRY